MKISTRSRYGTRLMVYLAVNFGKGPIFLKDIADAENISLKYLSQIIIPIKAAGLVNAFRGAHGGYTLAKEPKDINIREIVEVLEGDLNIVDCVKNAQHHDCPRMAICVTRVLWDDVTKKIKDTLSGYTLEDLVKKYKKLSAGSVMYHI